MKKTNYFTLSSFPSSNISLSPYIIITVALLLADYDVDNLWFLQECIIKIII